MGFRASASRPGDSDRPPGTAAGWKHRTSPASRRMQRPDASGGLAGKHPRIRGRHLCPPSLNAEYPTLPILTSQKDVESSREAAAR